MCACVCRGGNAGPTASFLFSRFVFFLGAVMFDMFIFLWNQHRSQQCREGENETTCSGDRAATPCRLMLSSCPCESHRERERVADEGSEVNFVSCSEKGLGWAEVGEGRQEQSGNSSICTLSLLRIADADTGD